LFLSVRRRKTELLCGDVLEEEETPGVGALLVGFVLLGRIEEPGETVCGFTVGAGVDWDCAPTEGCFDLDTKVRCRVARRSIRELRRLLVPDDLAGVRTVGLFVLGVPIRLPTFLVELGVVLAGWLGRSVMFRRALPERDCPKIVPPSRDDELLDLVLADGV